MPRDPNKATPTTSRRDSFQPEVEWEETEDEDHTQFTYFVQEFDPQEADDRRTPPPPAPVQAPPPRAQPALRRPRPTKPGFVSMGPTRSAVSSSRFFCPHCNMEGSYTHYAVKWSLKVAGFPVFPLNHMCEYVECHTCASTYDLQVLQPAAASYGIEPLHLFAAKRVMILVMMADGVIDDAEVNTIGQVYEQIGGPKISDTQIRTEIGLAVAEGQDLLPFLASICNKLNERGKLTVFRSAYAVAAADGSFQDEERQLMYALVHALHLAQDPFELLGLEAM